MNKVKWMAKKIETQAVWDENDVLTIPYSFDGYELKYKTDGMGTPSPEYDIIEGPDIPREYGKIEKDADGIWQVVLDQTKKDTGDALIVSEASDKTAAQSAGSALRSAAAVIDAEPGISNSTKVVLKNILRAIRHLMNEVK